MNTIGIDSVLIFDPDPFYRRLIYSLLLSFEIPEVSHTGDLEEAESIIKTKKLDCVVLDWDMEGKTQLQLVEQIRLGKMGPNLEIPVLLCTAHTRRERILSARDAGVSEIIVKPVSPQQMLDKILASCFKMRRFIRSEDYNGPDRRRRDLGYDGEDRRKSDMKQEDIDTLMAEGEEA